ncbi:MAG: twin-arginine translocase subunit TatC [Firmicutes bacterium]|nr:twin-arginine translocase subunit TatC [Bacillota bacterium]MCL5994094.1 twin-arginine translocase subunit TatC [Bacillota bacterium]
MAKEMDTGKVMSLMDHLEDFRKRLIICGIAVMLAALISFLYVDQIRLLLTRPIGELVYLNLMEAVTTNIRLAFIAGFFIALPVIFYQIWCFVLPGLYRHERRAVFWISVLSLFFFALGVTFAYFVILPFSVNFLLGFADYQLQPMISFNSYISYSLGLLIGFGLVFEMPVVMLILAKLGIVSSEFLARNRMYAMIIIFILAAIFTPPDVISQLLMGIPMTLLYELSILMARFVRPRVKDIILEQ